uniref:Uncharacterized protein n=1 Tax=Leptocylindrus danicus TaxID=163516 RepID=A0A7S2LNH8_9STRA|mmetsp:Transcript_7202/g.10758  ORF Transcript_7202/g.10758 Transcript_7202/m.10758 type:complete len:411 (+) Transcript_7202:175-1407(+)|eukprot:CAMPEP_0116031208 /NCGR_PEP_ID=MMETSP0321-20121206/17361_1 /TAXON_ID=163516 /ORGANISM="Leptocylindrus danicus var. danicus, Strain B650" /LENGTH=410 /DNA_ID=CAMNT_0003506257 /DNA_START=100 /DNA_END=1332 /DNA_ORIENTATION=+
MRIPFSIIGVLALALLVSVYFDFYWLVIIRGVNVDAVVTEKYTKADKHDQRYYTTSALQEGNTSNVTDTQALHSDFQNLTRSKEEVNNQINSSTATAATTEAELKSSKVRTEQKHNSSIAEEKEDVKGFSEARGNQPEVATVQPTLKYHHNPILPKRLISVFGLESSGTRLLTKAIAVASGAATIGNAGGVGGFDGRLDRYKKLRGIEVQHLSLPFGSTCQEVYRGSNVIEQARQYTLSVLTPRECGVSDENSWDHSLLWAPTNRKRASTYADRILSKYCHDAGLNDFTRAPKRFFVNVTSHIRWYLDRGVQATAVLVLRDKTIQHMSKVKNHCNSQPSAYAEDSYGMQIMTEAFEKLSYDVENPSLVLVSYEMLMNIGDPYLFSIFEKLGIQSSYTPDLKDGNKVYLSP